MKTDVASRANIEVEVISTPVVTVSRAEAYSNNGQLYISGAIRRMHNIKLPGHIDVSVVGSNGVPTTKSVAVPGLSSKRKGAINLPFRVQFDLEPAAVSKILIKYHPRTGAQGGHHLSS